MNSNPTKARQAKQRKRRGKVGSLADVQALLWAALMRAGDLLEAETISEDGQSLPDDATALKAVHAISQGAASYARLVTAGELEERLAALEATGEGQNSGPRLGKGAA